jgi:hypothetical protein
MSRWKAAGLHLGLSALVGASALALMVFVWYPPPLFVAEGGSELVLILVGVDVAIGPLVTLIVFRAGKPGLRFDLATIGVLQAAALAYGMHVVFLARPVYLVFVKDRFEVARAAELDAEALAEARDPRFRSLPLWGPALAAADFPHDPAERNRLVELALAGIDLHHFPKYYAPYAERRAEVLARAKTVERLRATEPTAARVVDEYLRESGRGEETVRALMLRARRAWVAVVLDARTAEPLAMRIAERI